MQAPSTQWLLGQHEPYPTSSNDFHIVSIISFDLSQWQHSMDLYGPRFSWFLCEEDHQPGLASWSSARAPAAQREIGPGPTLELACCLGWTTMFCETLWPLSPKDTG